MALLQNKLKMLLQINDLTIFCPTVLIKIIISNTKRFIEILKEIINDIIFEKFPYVTYEKKGYINNIKPTIKNFNSKNFNLYNQT